MGSSRAEGRSAPLLVGVLTAATASVIAFRDLGRPALWLDEGATVVAVRRSWAGLWALVQGVDAPLVPYYAFLKLVLGPGAATEHPEVAFRVPSAVAMVVAAGLLATWVARRADCGTAVGVAGVMLTLGSVTRYAQEARPYGLVVLLAVVSTVVRERALRGRASWAVLYATSLAALVLMNTLAVTLVVAHLAVAATGRRSERWRDLALSGLLAAAGVLIALPQAAAAVTDGGGAGSFPSRTPGHLAMTLLRLFSPDGRLTAGAALVLLLAALGLTRIGSPQHDLVARTAVAWAVAPLAVLLLAVLVRPNLQMSRYLLFTAPGWAVLAGLGLAATGSLAAQAIGSGRVVLESVSVGLGLAVLIAAQTPALESLRHPDGHGDNIRPVVAAAGTVPDLPVFVATRFGAVQFAAYDPGRRPVNLDAGQDLTSVWPSYRPGHDVREDLRQAPAVVLIARRQADLACLEMARGPDLRTRCLPTTLRTRHYVAGSRPRFSSGWAVLVATRPAPYCTGVDRRLRSTSTRTGIRETTTTTAMIGRR